MLWKSVARVRLNPWPALPLLLVMGRHQRKGSHSYELGARAAPAKVDAGVRPFGCAESFTRSIVTRSRLAPCAHYHWNLRWILCAALGRPTACIAVLIERRMASNISTPIGKTTSLRASEWTNLRAKSANTMLTMTHSHEILFLF